MTETKEAKQGFLKKWLPLFVMGLAIVIIVLDTTLLNVSLGTIVRELHTNIQSLEWVITAYSLTLAALTITGGRFGDLFGRKKMFMVGATIFAIGSFLASISHSVGMLIIGESIIEGIGAALMMPSTAALLVTTYRGRERALALGVWGGMAAAGSAIGPVLGGYLTSHYSWRWGFRINIFVAAILLLSSVIIKETKDLEEKPTIDWLGVFLTATGLTSVVFGIIESASYGWWKAKSTFSVAGHALHLGGLSIVPVSIALGIILLWLFFVWEQRMVRLKRTPLVSMKIFKNRQFTSGALVTAFLSIGQVGLIFALPVFLQGVRGLDALHTGYNLLPMSFGLLIMAPLGGFMSKHFKPRSIIQVGFVVNVFALMWLRASLSATAPVWHLAFPLLVYGAGTGLVFSQITNITLSAVSPQESGEASGVNNTLRQVGSSLGTAIIGSMLIASIGSGLAGGINDSPKFSPERRAIVSAEARTQASAIEFGIPFQGQSQLTPEERAEVKTISDSSTVKANRQTLLIMVSLTLVALILSTRLPGGHQLERHESLANSSH